MSTKFAAAGGFYYGVYLLIHNAYHRVLFNKSLLSGGNLHPIAGRGT